MDLKKKKHTVRILTPPKKWDRPKSVAEKLKHFESKNPSIRKLVETFSLAEDF